MVPPAWEKIQRMSGNRVAAPLNTRLAMVRVVSVPYSIAKSVISGSSPAQQIGPHGWV